MHVLIFPRFLCSRQISFSVKYFNLDPHLCPCSCYRWSRGGAQTPVVTARRALVTAGPSPRPSVLELWLEPVMILCCIWGKPNCSPGLSAGSRGARGAAAAVQPRGCCGGAVVPRPLLSRHWYRVSASGAAAGFHLQEPAERSSSHGNCGFGSRGNQRVWHRQEVAPAPPFPLPMAQSCRCGAAGKGHGWDRPRLTPRLISGNIPSR